MIFGGLLGKVGRGINQALENAAYNTLAPGLLGDALVARQPPGGLLAPGFIGGRGDQSEAVHISPQQQADDPRQMIPQGDVSEAQNQQGDFGSPAQFAVRPAPVQPIPQQQAALPQQRQFQPTPEQRHQMVGQYLGAVSNAFKSGDFNTPFQDYRANLAQQINIGQTAQLEQQQQAVHKQMLLGFQQEMQQAAGNPEMQRLVLMKYSPVLGPEVKQYVETIKATKPDVNKVHGQLTMIDPKTGKLVELTQFEDGTIAPVPGGFTPPRKLASDGLGGLYDPTTPGDPYVSRPQPKAPLTHVINTQQGVFTVPNSGTGEPTPLMFNGHILKPPVRGTGGGGTPGLTGPGTALDALPPKLRGIAQSLAVGDFDPKDLSRLKEKELIFAAAGEINRNWTPQVYATKKNFTDPAQKGAKDLATISRIVGHIQRFQTNNPLVGFSPIYGSGEHVSNFRDGTQTALAADAHAIAEELQKLMSGGSGAMTQVHEWQQALGSTVQSVREAAINEISQLAGSQYEAMNQTYKASTGSNLPLEKLVTPAGREWMKANRINVTGENEAAPAPANAPPAQNQVRYHNGAAYRFDGRQWVLAGTGGK